MRFHLRFPRSQPKPTCHSASPQVVRLTPCLTCSLAGQSIAPMHTRPRCCAIVLTAQLRRFAHRANAAQCVHAPPMCNCQRALTSGGRATGPRRFTSSQPAQCSHLQPPTPPRMPPGATCFGARSQTARSVFPATLAATPMPPWWRPFPQGAQPFSEGLSATVLKNTASCCV